MGKNFATKEKKLERPGDQFKMKEKPETIRENYKGSGKLEGKVALITGGDSGIGRAAAVHFAREGADIVLSYFEEDKDANKTRQLVNNEGRKCLNFRGDLRDESHCKDLVSEALSEFGSINILVNNAATQYPEDKIEDITLAHLNKTFETNIISMIYLSQLVVPHLKKGDSVINTTSVTAYRGSNHLLDYASTKGAIVSFTRSLAKQLAEKGIRVNGVAPGPIWTPLIPATFDEEDLKNFGKKVPMGRPGQPSEVGPAYVFLASDDSSYMTGQVLHINGGKIIGG